MLVIDGIRKWRRFFYLFVYLKLFLIYCMKNVFLQLFLFVYYYNIVYKKLVSQKMRNPNGAQIS